MKRDNNNANEKSITHIKHDLPYIATITNYCNNKPNNNNKLQ